MGRNKHRAEEIISKLREAEVLQANGMSMEEVMRQLEVSDAKYYKWRSAGCFFARRPVSSSQNEKPQSIPTGALSSQPVWSRWLGSTSFSFLVFLGTT